MQVGRNGVHKTMITLTREEAQQVLKDLEGEIPFYSENDCSTPEWITDAIELLRARLAQPEPEPVAWLHSFTGYGWQVVSEKLYPTDQPLYTAQPQREWQGLTDDELIDTANNAPFETMVSAEDYIYVIVRAIEAKLKEKNA